MGTALWPQWLVRSLQAGHWCFHFSLKHFFHKYDTGSMLLIYCMQTHTTTMPLLTVCKLYPRCVSESTEVWEMCKCCECNMAQMTQYTLTVYTRTDQPVMDWLWQLGLLCFCVFPVCLPPPFLLTCSCLPVSESVGVAAVLAAAWDAPADHSTHHPLLYKPSLVSAPVPGCSACYGDQVKGC